MEMPAHTIAVVVDSVYPSFVPIVTADILPRDAAGTKNPNFHRPGIQSPRTEPNKKENLSGNTKNPRIHDLNTETLENFNIEYLESPQMRWRDAMLSTHGNTESIHIDPRDTEVTVPTHGNTEKPRIYGCANTTFIHGNNKTPRLYGRSTPGIEFNINIVNPVHILSKLTTTPYGCSAAKVSTQTLSQVT
jgi:hypothetical protein